MTVGLVLQSPRLLVAGSNFSTNPNDNYIIGEFRTEFQLSSSAGLKIRGSRVDLTHLCTSFIDLSNFDANEGPNGTEFELTRLCSDRQAGKIYIIF